MKKIFIISYIGFTSLLLMLCCQKFSMWQNKDFERALNIYFSYLDSAGYKCNFDYIYIDAAKKNDSTLFVIYLSGGAYDFLHERDRVIDFIDNKKYDILLLGDFPNEIVNIKKRISLNIMEDIVKERYPTEYSKYLQDERSVAPMIYDDMKLKLIFIRNKLVSFKRLPH